MSFSIKNFRNTSAKLVILDPVTVKPLIDPETNESVILEVVGQESKEFADAKLEAELKTIELMKSNKKLSPAEHRQLAFAMFAAFVVGWNETATKFIGEEFSKEAALKLMSNKDYFWLVKQVETFISDRTQFFTQQ
jgi:hypothetical protein